MRNFTAFDLLQLNIEYLKNKWQWYRIKIKIVIWYTNPSHFIFTYPLTTGVVRAPQMTLQPVSSIFLHCRLGRGELQACPACLVFFPLSLCIARLFWQDLMKRDTFPYHFSLHFFLHWSGDLHVVWLPAGSWHRLSHWQCGLCVKCVVSVSYTHLTLPTTAEV